MLITVPCPAKINLFLSVGPRDRRGYHPIRTVFQAIALHDTLEIESADGTELIIEGAELPEQNTVTKALRLVSELIELPPLKITLKKQIPAESGLGGGSSDAAGIIRAAQAISGLRIPAGELQGVAAAIGADVPFFLVGGRANATGYGEKLEPLPDSPAEHLLIVRPNVGCPTAGAYRQLDEKEYVWRELPDEDELYNDFERVAPCESLDLIERLLAHGARDAGLSGSGSAVFGRFHTETQATLAKERFASESSALVWQTVTISRAKSVEIIRK